jgi:general secretion pathway protein C
MKSMGHHNQRMVSRLSAFVIWALVAGGAVFWSLRLLASPLQAPPQTTAVSAAQVARGDLQRLFGAPKVEAAAAAAQPSAAARFKLVGVVAARSPAAHERHGVALLTVDGKPPRAVQVGAAVDGDWRLQSVSARAVTLAATAGGSVITLELPPMPPPATGQLPPVTFSSENPPGAPAPNGAPPPGADPAMAQQAALLAAQQQAAMLAAQQAAQAAAMAGQQPEQPPAGFYVPPDGGGMPPTAR